MGKCEITGGGVQKGGRTKIIRKRSIFDEGEKRTSAEMTEVEKRRRDERGSCRVRGCGW